MNLLGIDFGTTGCKAAAMQEGSEVGDISLVSELLAKVEVWPGGLLDEQITTLR